MRLTIAQDNWHRCWINHLEAAKRHGNQESEAYKRCLPRLICSAIECASGLIISAQASPGHYCEFRSVDLGGTMPFDWKMDGRIPSTFEVMLIGDKYDGVVITERFQSPETDDPFGWVSADEIEELIEANGGLGSALPDYPDGYVHPSSTLSIIDLCGRKLSL